MSRIEPMPFQIAGAEFLAGRRRALLRDKMGLGKTAQALLAARLTGARELGVVCNAAARPVWPRERDKWAPGLVLDVRSYDDVRLGKGLPAGDALVLDEAHYLKTPDAARTKAVYGPLCKGEMLDRYVHVWAMSGTFAPNNAAEYWAHFRALFENPLSYMEWVKRYTKFRVHPRFGVIVDANRKENLPELNRLIASVSLGRRPEDVFPDFPKVSFHDWPLENADSIKMLVGLEADAMRDAEVARLYAMTGDFDLALAEADPHIASLRRELGRWKAGAAARQIAEELRDGAYEKIVVFALHHDVLDQMAHALRDFNPLQIDGRVPPGKARGDIEEAFQTRPEHRVFLGQIQSCGTSITLTAAHHVAFVEQSWVPGENLQAAYRCRRIGQTRPVLVRVASVAGTLDEAIDRALCRKAQMIEETEGTHP